jgi:enoyl-CoA hydratase/carnithine racemase
MIQCPEHLGYVSDETGNHGMSEAVLAEFWRRLEADREIRAVALTGTGERVLYVGAHMKNVGKSGLEYWAAAGWVRRDRTAHLFR